MPDIGVPLELTPKFAFASASNQSIWSDMYIPKSAPPGLYTGTVTIAENGSVTGNVPVSLTVRNFALPDVPDSRTMQYVSYHDLVPRFGSEKAALAAYRNELRVAHRHKIAIIGDNFNWERSSGKPNDNWLPFLDGSGFSTASGYTGAGAGIGQDVFSIGTYRGLTRDATQDAFTTRLNSWATWFESKFPAVERFVYLCDESVCKDAQPTLAKQLERLRAISGAERRLPTLATQGLIDAPPALSFPTSTWAMSGAAIRTTRTALAPWTRRPLTPCWRPHRPANPSTTTAIGPVRAPWPPRMMAWPCGSRPGASTRSAKRATSAGKAPTTTTISMVAANKTCSTARKPLVRTPIICTTAPPTD